MEASVEEKTPAGAFTMRQGVQLKASAEAIAFMSSIEPVELLRCVFADSLVTVSEGGRHVGDFNVTLEFARRIQQPCVMLFAQSQGTIDNCPCGTTVTAYLTTNLEVLEEDYHEYVRLEGQTLDKRFHMVQHDGLMMINKVTTVGEEVTKESISYPKSVIRGLVTEGSTLLLMRLMALRKKVPQNMTFISLNQELKMSQIILSELDVKELDIGGETVKVFGMQRTIHSVGESPATWLCYFLEDGHLASRVHVGSPVTAKLLHLPSQPEKGFEKIPLIWEEDMEMWSKFLDRKEELKADHSLYFRKHPEIRAIISDFMQFLLLRKPDDVFRFAKDYFLPFASQPLPDSNLEASSS
ncbi:ciliogenesis-associated TTC17-interacting protein [Limanda limanda]|uniref:ciliogenesis-associated TTC17-interacting protein n=1 Tax=Limanda limanda TaxID=27771 RepID=UPI0029C84EDB|nr:ciliogenesis-associated TTC17-interacting protein [Limanda limanda]